MCLFFGPGTSFVQRKSRNYDFFTANFAFSGAEQVLITYADPAEHCSFWTHIVTRTCGWGGTQIASVIPQAYRLGSATGGQAVDWRAAALSWLALHAIGCSPGEPDRGTVRLPVVYGQDGRVEAYEEPDELIRSTALENGLTLMDATSLGITAEGAVHVDTLSAKDQLGLCSDERFADQPAPARCSAVLVRPDLALTAGHCMRTLACEDMVVVRGFAYDGPGELRPLRTSDLARCTRVLHREPLRDPSGQPGLDYAWLELDHPFDAPASLVIEPAAAIVDGETAVLVGNGVGVPLKIDTSGKVIDADAATGRFRASVDNFGGGSGAGVFDVAGGLLGIAVTGAPDYGVTPEGCRKARALDESRAMESVTYAARAVEGLCAASPRADVCEADRPSCGIGRERRGGPFWSLLVAIVLCGRSIRRPGT